MSIQNEDRLRDQFDRQFNSGSRNSPYCEPETECEPEEESEPDERCRHGFPANTCSICAEAEGEAAYDDAVEQALDIQRETGVRQRCPRRKV